MIPIQINLTALLHALRTMGALFCASLLAACSPFTLLNGTGPDSGYRNLTTVRYGSEARQQLDVYQPAVSRNGIVVVFFTAVVGAWGSVRNIVLLHKP